MTIIRNDIIKTDHELDLRQNMISYKLMQKIPKAKRAMVKIVAARINAMIIKISVMNLILSV